MEMYVTVFGALMVFLIPVIAIGHLLIKSWIERRNQRSSGLLFKEGHDLP